MAAPLPPHPSWHALASPYVGGRPRTGLCNLCNAGVRFVAKRDPNRRIMFCSVQSRAAEPYLRGCGSDRQTGGAGGRGKPGLQGRRACIRVRGEGSLRWEEEHTRQQGGAQGGGGTGVGGAGRRVRVGVWAGSVGAAGSALQSAPMTLAAADEASCPSSQPCPPPLLPGRATTALAPGRRHRAGACLHPPTRRCTTAPPPPQGGPDAAGRFAPLHLHRVSPGLGSGGRSQ